MARKWLGSWQGGRTLRDRNGKPGWVLERMVGGARFTKRLEAKSEGEALAELALFDRDPSAYVTAKEQAQQALQGALVVCAETIGQVRDHLLQKKRDPDYVTNVVSYLATWGEDLAGADLRKLSVQNLKLLLTKHQTAKAKRVASLKSFTAFFRTELNTLPAGEDPTLGLMSLQYVPAKMKKEKGYSKETIEAVYAAIHDWETERTAPDAHGRTRPVGCIATNRREGWGTLQGVRDVLVMRAKFGMHQSEIDRLSSGAAILKPLKGQGEIAGTVRFTHKSGQDHTLSLDAQGFAAAQRLATKGGAISYSYVRATLKYAARRAGVAAFLPGELRHSFITIARTEGREVKPKSGGVDLATIASVVGHHGTHTTAGSYLGGHVPSMILIPLGLKHPEDPQPLLKVVSSAP